MAVNESPTSGTAAVQPAMDASAGRAGRPDGASIGPMQLFTAFTRLSLSGFGGVLPFAYRALVENRKWLDAREFASLLAIAQVMPGPTICNLSVMIGQRYAGFAGSCAALAGMVLGPSCIVIALGIAWQHYGELSAVKRALGGMSAVAIGLIFATAVKMGINLFRSEPAVIASRPVPGAGVQPGGSDAVVPTSSSQDPATGSSLDSANGSPHAAAPAPSIASSPCSDAASDAASSGSSLAPTEAEAAARYWNWQRLSQVVLCALGFVGVGLLRWPLAAVVAGLAPIAIALSWVFEG